MASGVISGSKFWTALFAVSWNWWLQGNCPGGPLTVASRGRSPCSIQYQLTANSSVLGLPVPTHSKQRFSVVLRGSTGGERRTPLQVLRDATRLLRQRDRHVGHVRHDPLKVLRGERVDVH